MAIRLSEKAMYTTVKLTVEKPECSEIATGFIFKYFRNEKDSLPVIVTNTHVIKDWKRITFLLNSRYNIRKSNEVCNAISSTYMSSCIPMNICNVIKSTKLLDFEPILREELTSLTDR